MARYCFILRALRETGWRNYSLFARPDGLVILEDQIARLEDAP